MSLIRSYHNLLIDRRTDSTLSFYDLSSSGVWKRLARLYYERFIVVKAVDGFVCKPVERTCA